MPSKGETSNLGLVIALGAFVGIGLLGVVLGLGFQRARDSARFARSHGRFGQLKLALHSYHLDYGCFPPAYVANEHGMPMHSWRVLILPHLDVNEQEAYNRYDFTQPWDGPDNRALGESMGGAPGFFRSDDDRMADKSWTTYVGVSGPAARWPRKQPMRAYLVTEGSDQFLLVEVPNSGIHWMEPRDKTYD